MVWSTTRNVSGCELSNVVTGNKCLAKRTEIIFFLPVKIFLMTVFSLKTALPKNLLQIVSRKVCNRTIG